MKEKSFKIGAYLKMILIGIVFGLGEVYLLRKFPMQMETLPSMILLMSTIIISTYIHIVIHEFGHFIFGKLVGYNLSTFRIASFVFVDYGQGIEIKRFNIPGTGGQCLMVPGYDMKDNAFLFYNLGGGVFGIMTSLIIGAVVFAITNNPIAIIIGMHFVIIGIIMNFMNLIPMNIGGVNNDGKNITMFTKDKDIERDFETQLRLNDRYLRGEMYSDMTNVIHTIKLRTTNNSIDNTNIWFYSVLIQYYMENKEFEKAEEIIDRVLDNGDNIISLILNEIYCDKLFLSIIQNKEDISIYYNKVKSYLKASKYMQDKVRLFYAYELLVKNNRKNADKLKMKFEKLNSQNPYKGQIKYEKKIIDYIDSLYEEKNMVFRENSL